MFSFLANMLNVTLTCNRQKNEKKLIVKDI